MTKKNKKKDAARARQELLGGKYQSHLRQEGGADGRSKQAITVLTFDPSGRQFLGILWFVPPGLPNGAPDPAEGLIMGGIPALKAGPYLLLEATGRARHVFADRSAGGGSFMVRFTAPDDFMALQVIYASQDLGDDGMPRIYERYKIIPHRKQPPAGVYALGILPFTEGARVEGVRAFGWQAWQELFALLDAEHTGLTRRVVVDVQAQRGNEAGAPGSKARGMRGGMRGLGLLLTPEFLEKYHQPVADLGVTQVRRTTRQADGVLDGLYFFLPDDASREQERALIRRLRGRWGDDGIELVVLRQRERQVDLVWSWKDESAELRRQVEGWPQVDVTARALDGQEDG